MLLIAIITVNDILIHYLNALRNYFFRFSVITENVVALLNGLYI